MNRVWTRWSSTIYVLSKEGPEEGEQGEVTRENFLAGSYLLLLTIPRGSPRQHSRKRVPPTWHVRVSMGLMLA